MTDPVVARPLYFDCDTGIDDALALAYLLASPEVDVVGIGSVSGNVSAEAAARNTLDLLALAGRSDIRVAVGAHDPIDGLFGGGAPQVHGTNGLGGVRLPRSAHEPIAGDAAQFVIDLAHTHPGELDVLAVGPLTNLAIALKRDPSLVGLVRTVVVMGGAALVAGNATAVAEANIWHDAEAARLVFEAEWDVVVVPLDATMGHVLREEHREALAASGAPFLQSIAASLDAYFEYYVSVFGVRCAAMHDPLAAAIAVGTVVPVRAPSVRVIVDDSAGPGRGQTICDLRMLRVSPQGVPGVRTRVILSAEPDLASHLVERLSHHLWPQMEDTGE
ncbi:nucleoside hydrolase [Rathayibacter soli]|uniref:nucleoside hydrolase n=1 Tax=Rathayibacter soli TaxID=3144168 RepID=UPI0027E5B961|nr:nucleoside hydrolase [Glaciibacter superstes]